MNTVAELFPLIKSHAGSAGSCSIEDVMERMNIIGPQILNKIEAKGTISKWCLCICRNCLVLPSDLETPIQASLNGESLGFRGQYWTGRLAGDSAGDLGQMVPWQEMVEEGGYAYTQVYPIPVGQNDVFEVIARSPADAGKEVTITYRDASGRLIHYKSTLVGDRLASSPSNTGIGQVVHVIKPRTVGAVELWTRNLHNDDQTLVAVYDGHDEHPSYRLYHITGCANGSITIKGKRKWMPLRSPDDIVMFGQAAVWQVALVAESFLANRDLASFKEALAEAVGLLDDELTSLRPKGTAEIVDFVTPFTLFNRSPLRSR